MAKRLYSLALFIVLLGILVCFVRLRMPTQAVSAPDAEEETQTSAAPALVDSETYFTALSGNEITTQTMDFYLIGTIAGEMPASFDIEALKAQAVAARTYILYKTAHRTSAHPDAAVCDDAACCKAFLTDSELLELWGENYSAYREKIYRAVTSTDGEYLVYGGEPIQAVFHSSSAGYTEDSGSIWADVPYLVSVDTPETESDVPNFVSTVEVSCEDFASAIAAEYPAATFSGDAASWMEETSLTDTGRVSEVLIGGISVSGSALRQIFSLRSTAFSLEYTGGSFLFTVTGFGHGVGMSQYGANIMALRGASYDEILLHYYTGAELTQGNL